MTDKEDVKTYKNGVQKLFEPANSSRDIHSAGFGPKCSFENASVACDAVIIGDYLYADAALHFTQRNENEC